MFHKATVDITVRGREMIPGRTKEALDITVHMAVHLHCTTFFFKCFRSLPQTMICIDHSMVQDNKKFKKLG